LIVLSYILISWMYGVVVNIKACDLYTKQGWATGSLQKLAHGCRANQS